MKAKIFRIIFLVSIFFDMFSQESEFHTYEQLSLKEDINFPINFKYNVDEQCRVKVTSFENSSVKAKNYINRKVNGKNVFDVFVVKVAKVNNKTLEIKYRIISFNYEICSKWINSSFQFQIH